MSDSAACSSLTIPVLSKQLYKYLVLDQMEVRVWAKIDYSIFRVKIDVASEVFWAWTARIRKGCIHADPHLKGTRRH